ncbi:UNVERIFIED_CONTAM: sporulation histidine kinase inhibitor Sda [Halobacillus marinus]
MNQLSDELLIDTYRVAGRLGLSEDFQTLLRTEIKKRGILDFPQYFGCGNGSEKLCWKVFYP